MNWHAHLERLKTSVVGLGAKRLIALAVIGLISFSAVGVGAYIMSRSDMETLYGGLTQQDVTRIGAALREAGISFDVNMEGTKVLVRVGEAAQARMLLAEKGLPSSANAGYELFDKLGTLGLTSFMQEITRVRALEGEIARTIQTMKGVKAARVHLVLPETGSFRHAKQPPSSSVVVRTDASGDFQGADAIRHLVAAAVPGMTIDQVRVLSTDGAVLASGGDPTTAAPARMVELQKTIGKELQENVRKTLAPYLGLGNFEISVAARLNLDKRQSSETTFDPETKVERSLRTIKETGSSTNMNGKPVVTVEQNIPADPAATKSGDESRRSSERKETLSNYEVSSRTIQTTSEGYRVENLTVAVVVNRKRLVETLGSKATPEAIDAAMKEVERLVGTATGLDNKRGDRLTVAAVDFLPGNQILEPVPGPSLVEQLLRHTGSFVTAAAMLGATFLLIWLGVRPATKALLQATPEAAAIDDGPLGGMAMAGLPGMMMAPEPLPTLPMPPEEETSLIADLASRAGLSPQKRLEQVIEFSEEQAAAILKQWMREA